MSEARELSINTDRAELYDEIYTTIFDYREQFEMIHKILEEYGCEDVVEVASGCGHLTSLIHEKGYHVLGSDISQQMLKIARTNAPEVQFLQQDMRELSLKKSFDAVICLGNSFSFMTTDEDVDSALSSFYDALSEGGILIFDNFNAEETIRHFDERYRKRTQEIEMGDKKVVREHQQRWNLETGITWDWTCTYEIIKKGEVVDRFKDETTLRGFLKSELEYRLRNQGFTHKIFDPEQFLIAAQKED